MFEQSDLQAIGRLGYVIEERTGLVPGDWDHVDLYDAAKYGQGSTDRPIGLISRNSKGSWTVSLTISVYASGGDVSRNGTKILNRPRSRPRSVIVSRASVAESIAEAHRQREVLEGESKKVWDEWRSTERRRQQDSLASQRAASKHLT